MLRVAHFVDAVVGGDTHVDTTSLCVVSPVGAVLAEITIDNDEDGYAQAVTWVLQSVPSERFLVGLEGTRSYGAGLCRALQAVGIRVVEVERPSRGERGRRGKSDTVMRCWPRTRCWPCPLTGCRRRGPGTGYGRRCGCSRSIGSR